MGRTSPIDYAAILKEVESKAREFSDLQSFYAGVVAALKRIPYYNWVGFYFLNDGVLELGPYLGKPTEHVRIKVGQGVCGRAVAERKSVIVDDVTKEENYLACSLETKSEIVTPVWSKGEIVGEIDIDSDDLGAFTHQDRDFLERVAKIVGNRIEAEKSAENLKRES